MAFYIQLATIVIFTFAIMLAIYSHDCWHHHNHDITQNLTEKQIFHCDGGHDNSDGAIAIIAVVSILMAAAPGAPWEGENLQRQMFHQS